jgi:hypothetical protein
MRVALIASGQALRGGRCLNDGPAQKGAAEAGSVEKRAKTKGAKTKGARGGGGNALAWVDRFEQCGLKPVHCWR